MTLKHRYRNDFHLIKRSSHYLAHFHLLSSQKGPRGTYWRLRHTDIKRQSTMHVFELQAVWYLRPRIWLALADLEFGQLGAWFCLNDWGIEGSTWVSLMLDWKHNLFLTLSPWDTQPSWSTHICVSRNGFPNGWIANLLSLFLIVLVWLLQVYF